MVKKKITETDRGADDELLASGKPVAPSHIPGRSGGQLADGLGSIDSSGRSPSSRRRGRSGTTGRRYPTDPHGAYPDPTD